MQTERNKQSIDNSSTVVQAKYFSQEKGILHLISLPLSNCLLSSVDHVAILLVLLLANSCLLSSCSFFFSVAYPDVLLTKQRRLLLLRACDIFIQKIIRTGFKREQALIRLW